MVGGFLQYLLPRYLSLSLLINAIIRRAIMVGNNWLVTSYISLDSGIYSVFRTDAPMGSKIYVYAFSLQSSVNMVPSECGN